MLHRIKSINNGQPYLKVILLILFIQLFHQSFAQSRTGLYAVFSDTHELIGELKVTSTENDTITQISVISQFSVQLLVRINVRYALKTIYYHNYLYSNSVITYKNDNINSVAKTVKKGTQYIFQKDAEQKVYSKSITFTESLLYFNEPLDKSVVYSEFDGIDKEICLIKPGHYQIINPVNGNISEYFYEAGTLQKAVVHVSFFPVSIERVN